jgi:hypothetical protein
VHIVRSAQRSYAGEAPLDQKLPHDRSSFGKISLTSMASSSLTPWPRTWGGRSVLSFSYAVSSIVSSLGILVVGSYILQADTRA